MNHNQSKEDIRRHCMIVLAIYPLGETRVQREAEALVSHGYEVDVICARISGEAAVDEHRGVRIHRETYLPPHADGFGQLFLIYLRFLDGFYGKTPLFHQEKA